MKQPAPEFSRPLQVDRVPRGGGYEKISAEPDERKALARRLDIPVLHALSAEMRATPWRGGGLKLEGALAADVEQVSVVSLEQFRRQVSYPVLRYFLPDGKISEHADEDADPIVAGLVDLGEVVAETLVLELDPYPRQDGEGLADPVEPPADAEAKVSPFAKLAALKPK